MLRTYLIFPFLFFQAQVLAWDYNFESYFSTQQKPFSYSQLDPTNQLFKLSRQTNQLDVRLNVRHQTKNSKWIMRGRFLGTSELYPYKENDMEFQHSEILSKWDLTDLFYEQRWSGKFYTVLGLQVYQWGAGELMNPSNPFFHFIADQRSAFYKEKGKILGRAHFDLTSNLSLSVIGEPESNREPDFYYDEEFSPKYLGKIEWLSDSQKDGLSISYGQERKNVNFIGFTSSYEFFEGFSFYIDGRASEKVRRQTPEYIPSTTILVFNEKQKTGYSPIALTGLRLETENYDMRLEYILNERGFSKAEFVEIRKSLKSASAVLSLQGYLQSGLELPGQQYLYLSMRRSRLGSDDDQTLSLRYLMSLQDSSGAVLATYEAPFQESWTFFLETHVGVGQEFSELSFIKQNRYMLGFSYFF